MKLHIQEEDSVEMLTDLENQIVLHHFSRIEKRGIDQVIVGREGNFGNPEKLEMLRQAILTDYGGSVLRDRVHSDPPERGLYGNAYIPLKEGAIPQNQKPFYLHGEKLEAFKQVTED